MFISYTLPFQTLSEYAQDPGQYFNDSNLTLTFLPGNHTLDINLTITNIYQLEIHSALLPTRVVCDSHVGFTFSNISKLSIDGLAFVACAARRDMYIHSIYTGADSEKWKEGWVKWHAKGVSQNFQNKYSLGRVICFVPIHVLLQLSVLYHHHEENEASYVAWLFCSKIFSVYPVWVIDLHLIVHFAYTNGLFE